MATGILLEMNPLLLTPTVSIRAADQARIAEYRVQLANGRRPNPIKCFETSGYFLIVDGHHRWAAYLTSESIRNIPVELIDAEQLAALGPLRTDTIYRKVDWSSVYDWEAAFSVRLLNGAYDESCQRTLLTVISGPSGAGKSQIINELKRNGIRMPSMKTTTTRAKRVDEVDGREYEFVSSDQFEALVRSGTFLEWQQIHGNLYGSRWDLLFPMQEDGLRIRDLDAYGALQIKSLYAGAVQTVFVDVPDFDDLRARIVGRGTDSPEETMRRLSRARAELELRPLFDYRVVNSSLKVAAEQILQIARTRRLTNLPIPFFVDPVAFGHYVVLEIRGDNGVMSWANLRHRVAPLLRLRDGVTVEAGFRSLESLLIDHLLIELRGEDGGGTILRGLIKSLDEAQIREVRGLGASTNVSCSVKTIEASADLLRFLGEKSIFFGIEREVFPCFEGV